MIRAKAYDGALLAGAPEGFPSAQVNERGYPDKRFTLQIAVEDCTGCGICIDHCPAHDPLEPGVKAINLSERLPLVEAGRRELAFFEYCPNTGGNRSICISRAGLQFVRPLFEFSGACAGCGETPYLKLLSQLFGDRLQIANATGCSSIYGGNLPSLPWRAGTDGRGPAWNNSLFEDNGEFGLGMRLAVDQQATMARDLVRALAERIGPKLADEILGAQHRTDSEIVSQRGRIDELRRVLGDPADGPARDLLTVAEYLVRRSLWIVGGDGWAYDIGAGGLDHVLAQNRDVNVLVLDTEVYSNTGGQASKATPLGASAKFAAAGKRTPRKDLALQAIAYGYVYVAQVALGGSPEQTIQALRDAEAYEGPALVLAYSHCIAHGYDMRDGMKQQHRAVASGYWPLFRYDPRMRKSDMNPFRLDSTRPRLPVEEFAYRELRYRVLTQTRPEEARMLMRQAQAAANERYRLYEDMAARDGTRFHPFWQDEAVTRDETPAGGRAMNLETRYLGLSLAHPVIAGASPLSATFDGIRRLEDAGAAAIVAASIYEEEVEAEAAALDAFGTIGAESNPEVTSYLPPLPGYPGALAAHLELIRRAADSISVPLIASLNGITREGWTGIAADLKAAGAAAVELDLFHLATDPRETSAEVERRLIETVRGVRAAVDIPVAVKLSPYFTAPARSRRRAQRCRGERHRPVQPVLRAGHRPRDAEFPPQPALVDNGGNPTGADVDRYLGRKDIAQPCRR